MRTLTVKYVIQIANLSILSLSSFSLSIVPVIELYVPGEQGVQKPVVPPDDVPEGHSSLLPLTHLLPPGQAEHVEEPTWI